LHACNPHFGGANCVAQESQETVTATVTFTPSTDGKTLTISGQGDLTTYQTTDFSAKKFTAAAVNNVFYDAWNSGNLNATVVEGQSYSPNVGYAYYSEEKQYLLLFDGGKPISGKEGFRTVTTAEDGALTYAMGQCGNDKFVKHAGEDSYTQLLQYETYAYVEGDQFFKSTNYVPISDNNLYFETEHPEYLEKDEMLISVAELTKSKILAGAYENVIFKNESAIEPLKIDKDILRAIMFPEYLSQKCNTNLKSLDLGAATIEDFTSNVFLPTDNNQYDYLAYNIKLENLTLPLTKKTTVHSESINEDVEKMVVPSKIMGAMASVESLTTVTIPSGYDRLDKEAFSNCSYVTNFSLPEGLTLIGESAFAGCSALQSIELNEKLENIGKKAFYGTGLTAVKFPSTLKIINDMAFCDCKMPLKFNAGLEFIGNSAFALSNNNLNGLEQDVLEIPASVKYIGPHAFHFREYKDVYFYGGKAPLMPLGKSVVNGDWDEETAFSTHTLNGNNGFDPTGREGSTADNIDDGYANRENYANHEKYICVLHYPKDLDDDARAEYTDITRKYLTQTKDFDKNNKYVVDEESKTFQWSNVTVDKETNYGYQDTYLGPQYVWPSQSQWMRAYITNYYGYNWNGKDTYRSTLSTDDIATLKYAGFDTSEDKLDELAKIAHFGTRLFVFANADAFKDDVPDKEPEYPIDVKGGEWWTICVPFNMTKAQVDEVFGKNTHVCRFNKVQRLVDNDNDARYIRLYFTNDVYVHKSTKDAETGEYFTSEVESVEDDDIVIYAHESYMIYPTKKAEKDEDVTGMYNVKDYQLVTGAPLPTIVKANVITDDDMSGFSPDDGISMEYRFIGNYQTSVTSSQSVSKQSTGISTMDMQTVCIPQYSYIYAVKGNDTKAQFWFYSGTKLAWQPNKCVVQATDRDGGRNDAQQYFGYEDDGNGNLYKPSGNNAKKTYEQSFFGMENGGTTGVEKVIIIAGDGEKSLIVYNLNGQVVNTKGEMSSLQPGVYVKNGKKYMVK